MIESRNMKWPPQIVGIARVLHVVAAEIGLNYSMFNVQCSMFNLELMYVVRYDIYEVNLKCRSEPYNELVIHNVQYNRWCSRELIGC